MNLDDLGAFCQLAKDGNYRIAAENLYITQSALTKKIQRLEATSGVALFERGRQGARLTLAGITLLPEAQRMVTNFKSYEMLTQLLARGLSGYLNIGFGISSYHLAPRFIALFKQTHSNVHITLNDIPSHKQLRALCQGELQVSFNRFPVPAPLKGIKLATDHLVVAIHKDRTIDESHLWASLSGLDYLNLNPERGMGLYRQVDALLNEHNQKLSYAQQANDIHTLLALVSADLGFTIVPASVRHIANDNVRFLPLTGDNSVWDIGLIWNADTESPVRDNFIEFIEQQTK